MNECEDNSVYLDRMKQYASVVEEQVGEWYKPQIDAIDARMVSIYLDRCGGDVVAVREFDALSASRVKLKNTITETKQRILLAFAAMLERLDDAGVWLIPEDLLEDTLKQYLVSLGIKQGQIEGACLDIL